MTVNIGDLLSYTRAQLGKSYVFATAGPDTFDCSGLVKAAFARQGVNLPHHSEDQATYGTAVSRNAIQPGDLVFSDWGDGANSHVGIAVSPTQIIDAPHKGAVVRYDNLSPSYLSHVTAVRRLAGVGGGEARATPGGGAPGGGSGGGGQSIISQFEGTLNKIVQEFTGPYQELAKPLQDIGSAATEAAKIGDKALSLFMPSNFIRIMSGLGGFILIIMGLWFLSLEVRNN